MVFSFRERRYSIAEEVRRPLRTRHPRCIDGHVHIDLAEVFAKSHLPFTVKAVGYSSVPCWKL